MAKSILPFNRKKVDQPTRFEKWSSISTIIATFISALALIISIVVMIDSKNQNAKTLQLAIQQFQQEEKARVMDSLHQVLNELTDSLRFNNELLRQDSLNQLHDSMTNAQLRLLSFQSDIINRQQYYQRLAFENDLVLKQPKFELKIDSIFEDTATKKITFIFAIKNNGGIDAYDVIPEILLINQAETQSGYSKGKGGVLSIGDEVNITLDIGEHFESKDLDEKICIILAISYYHPLQRKRLVQTIGWDYIVSNASEQLVRQTLPSSEVVKRYDKIKELYDDKISFKLVKNTLKPKEKKYELLVKNMSKSQKNNIKYQATIVHLGYNKLHKLKTENIRSLNPNETLHILLFFSEDEESNLENPFNETYLFVDYSFTEPSSEKRKIHKNSFMYKNGILQTGLALSSQLELWIDRLDEQ